MNLDQAALLAQIISALAIIVSLAFVGFQLRQATAAIRATSSQAHSGLYTTLVQSIIDSPEFADIWARGVDDPNGLAEGEWVRFVAYSSALFRLYESSRVQWLNGRLDPEHWHTIERQAVSMRRLPGVEASWKIRGHLFSPDFRQWFETLPAADGPTMYERSGRVGQLASKRQ